MLSHLDAVFDFLRDCQLSLGTVILLDRIQKKQTITDDAAAKLRREGLISGRKPHYYVSAGIARVTGAEAEFTISRGLQKKKLKEFVLQHLREAGPASRTGLETLLFGMLPADLTSEKKKNKVINLLSEMRAKDKTIKCIGKGPKSKWALSKSFKTGIILTIFKRPPHVSPT